MSNFDINQFKIILEPFYKAQSTEVELYTAAYNLGLPVMIKGPTGCGKSRFIEYMAYKLDKPIITVSCNEDITASDLIGRFLLDTNGTRWVDGPLTLAARHGAICYLDEIVEARQDTMVVIHSLTDHRRELMLDKKGELVKAHSDFQLVISYNPAYQSLMKDLKQSTKQRFTGMDFDYVSAELETSIVVRESGVGGDIATKLVKLAQVTRNLVGHGIDEGASTRLLNYAGTLIASGVGVKDACNMALVCPITDDVEIRTTMGSAIDAIFD
ncbi:CbbQ/NirQ/NorQ/GpvN family protein [Candidatus Vesicomyidisocius calyptogenae]|uniref:Rubisco regulator CbbQ n=1 Tax=Vesicomyosocius okutanii subsp. Calyptogena okutanii (strain HA) TaxID=412965 RepID=A5CWA9_VESOH|nr:CbbQ/NirQ/NorQ/GpvN family protein [Candidatus Vesicomyosocius okutanii]BAF61765.1 Rubisco regulator CbbQ [Candidatus Vesicomyosocius okutanii]